MRSDEGEDQGANSSPGIKYHTYADLLCFRPTEELNGSVRDYLKKEKTHRNIVSMI